MKSFVKCSPVKLVTNPKKITTRLAYKKMIANGEKYDWQYKVSFPRYITELQICVCLIAPSEINNILIFYWSLLKLLSFVLLFLKPT